MWKLFYQILPVDFIQTGADAGFIECLTEEQLDKAIDWADNVADKYWVENTLMKVAPVVPDPKPPVIKGAETIDSVADTLLKSADALEEYFLTTTASEIVILGRDGWPLVPLMRKKGITTKYFVWCRTTCPESAYKTWKQEVAPMSLIVDTGFAGSIFYQIRHQEPEHIYHYFVLLSSAGTYPQIKIEEGNNAWRDKILELEHAPKLCSRVEKYEKGVAKEVCFKDDCRNTTGEEAIAYNKALLLKCGLDEEEATKWSTFTGLTPESRGFGSSATEQEKLENTLHREWDSDLLLQETLGYAELQLLEDIETCTDREEVRVMQQRLKMCKDAQKEYTSRYRLIRSISYWHWSNNNAINQMLEIKAEMAKELVSIFKRLGESQAVYKASILARAMEIQRKWEEDRVKNKPYFIRPTRCDC